MVQWGGGGGGGQGTSKLLQGRGSSWFSGEQGTDKLLQGRPLMVQWRKWHVPLFEA